MPWNPTKPSHIYLKYMYKKELNKLQWLIWHQHHPIPPFLIWIFLIIFFFFYTKQVSDIYSSEYTLQIKKKE